MPAPQFDLTFSAGAEAVRRIEEVRQAREDRMRNALEILADVDTKRDSTTRAFAIFVQRVAREGLGHERS